MPGRLRAARDAEREAAVGGGVGDRRDEQRHEVRGLGADDQPCSNMNSSRYASVDATPTAPNRTTWRNSEFGAADRRSGRSQLGRNGIDRDRAVGEAAEQPADTLEVGGGGGDDVDPTVGVVDPVDGHLVDAQTAAFGEHQQLGVEEPSGVGDVGQQPARDVGADGLESALGVGEASRQRRACRIRL